MGFIYSLVGFLIAISVLVAVHEFGHFWVARKLGVKVLRFSVGFGKPLWKKVAGDDQIEYVIGAIPLGGYVKMLGDGGDEPIDPSERHRAFDNQPIWKRSLIVLAGPGINFLFAIILFMFLGMSAQEQIVPVFGQFSESTAVAKAGVMPGDTLVEIDGKSVRYMFEHNLYIFNKALSGKSVELLIEQSGVQKKVTVETKGIPIYNIDPASMMRQLGLVPILPPSTTNISYVLDGSPAANAGLKVGDQFVSIDNKRIETWGDLVDIVAPSAGKELEVGLSRDGVLLSMNVTPKAKDVDGLQIGILGVSAAYGDYQDSQIVRFTRSPIEATLHATQHTWQMSIVTLRMLGKMLTGKVSAKNVSGPITIADVAGQAIQISWQSYIYVIAAISISLGVMNLLPIPMLDGGHILMYAVEIVAGKSVAEKIFVVGQKIGILLLLSLMSLAFYNDIFRLLN